MIAQLDEIQWGKLVAEAWINPEFKAELMRAPGDAVRQFAADQFGLDLGGDIGDIDIPALPPELFSERLSGSSDVRGTITGSASAGGDVRSDVRGTICASASAGGDVGQEVRGTICASASAGGD